MRDRMVVFTFFGIQSRKVGLDRNRVVEILELNPIQIRWPIGLPMEHNIFQLVKSLSSRQLLTHLFDVGTTKTLFAKPESGALAYPEVRLRPRILSSSFQFQVGHGWSIIKEKKELSERAILYSEPGTPTLAAGAWTGNPTCEENRPAFLFRSWGIVHNRKGTWLVPDPRDKKIGNSTRIFQKQETLKSPSPPMNFSSDPRRAFRNHSIFMDTPPDHVSRRIVRSLKARRQMLPSAWIRFGRSLRQSLCRIQFDNSGLNHPFSFCQSLKNRKQNSGQTGLSHSVPNFARVGVPKIATFQG